MWIIFVMRSGGYRINVDDICYEIRRGSIDKKSKKLPDLMRDIIIMQASYACRLKSLRIIGYTEQE